MKRSLSTAAGVAALAMVITTGLDAQRITRRESRGEVHNRVTVTTVTAAINNTPRVVARLESMAPLTPERIRIVDVRPFISPARRSSYQATLANNAERIEHLRTELVTLDPVVRSLTDHRPTLTVDDVIAAGILDVIETGKSANVLVLYVDNRNRLGTLSGDTRRTLANFRPTTALLLTALQSSPEMVARVGALESLRLDRVRFIDIDALLKPADAASYRSAIRYNESSIRSLRAELSKRPLVMQALARQDAKLMLGDIFAADILGNDDALVLYYRRPAAADNAGTT